VLAFCISALIKFQSHPNPCPLDRSGETCSSFHPVKPGTSLPTPAYSTLARTVFANGSKYPFVEASKCPFAHAYRYPKASALGFIQPVKRGALALRYALTGYRLHLRHTRRLLNFRLSLAPTNLTEPEFPR